MATSWLGHSEKDFEQVFPAVFLFRSSMGVRHNSKLSTFQALFSFPGVQGCRVKSISGVTHIDAVSVRLINLTSRKLSNKPAS